MGSTVILPDFILPSRANQHWQYSGIDSIEHCLNKDYFRSYPHPIEYIYNSRGYRDAEWPSSIDELKNAVWCIGDSFTVGIGQPFDHIWPQVLSKNLGRRIINVSMDGASNDWISRVSKKIVSTFSPKAIVVLWSYFHRRESLNHQLSDELRKLHYSDATILQDLKNFQNCFLILTDLCNSTNTQHIHGLIPKSYVTYPNLSWTNIRDQSWPEQMPLTRSEFNDLPLYIQNEIVNKHKVFDEFDYYYSTVEFLNQHQIINVPQLDYARDYHHFDMLTSRYFVQHVVDSLLCN